jgi:hypothetical protein
MAKKKEPADLQFTVSAKGLLRILDVLNDELHGGPDGFVTAQVFSEGSVSIQSKGGHLLMHDDVDIYLGDKDE